MFIKDWKKDVFTIPNLLSILRLLLIPVYMTVYLKAEQPLDYYMAAIILALSCVTDALDGFIARHYNMVSTLGKILDPLADKVTQITLAVVLSTHFPSVKMVLYLLVIKEFLQLSAGIFYWKKGKMLSRALLPGKISTTILFISFILLILFPQIPAPVVTIITAIDLVFISISFLSYASVYLNPNTATDHFQS